MKQQTAFYLITCPFVFRFITTSSANENFFDFTSIQIEETERFILKIAVVRPKNWCLISKVI